VPRARNIKPGFYKNEDLAECSIWARFIFPGLWMLADREGRLEDRPKRIKGELLPFDGQDVEPLLRELEARGFIIRYRIEGASFIQITKFSTHQSPHYSEKPSVIKPHSLPENGRDISGSNSGSNGPMGPGQLPDHSEKPPPIKRGSQPPDSLNPDSLNPEKSNSMSGSASPAPDVVPRWKANGKYAQAKEILDYLNKITGSHFRPLKSSLVPIQARLSEGFTPERLKEIALLKADEWGKDDRMVEFLRPKTLYNATNCANYDGSLPNGVDSA